MKSLKRSFAMVSMLLMLLALPIETLYGEGAGIASRTAAASGAKTQCMNSCRVRYRDCRRLNQLPAFECRNVYHDCTRYSCSGLGPG